jgi:acyl-CoA thioesterase I
MAWYVLGAIGALGVLLWAVSLFRLRRSIKTFPRHWKSLAEQPGDFIYVALGDSAAQGIGATSPKESYVSLIARDVAARTGRTVRVINLSQSGAPTDDVIHRQLPLLAEYKADLVTLAIGGNDIRHRLEAPKFERNIRTIIERLPKGTYVADAPYFMHGQWERAAQQMRDITQRVSREQGMHVVRLYDRMKQDGWKSMFTSYGADWFHPNARGYRTWYKAFWDEITDRLPRN